MKPIFGKAPPLGIRLLIAIFASIALILADGRNSSITKARSAMETAIAVYIILQIALEAS